MALDFQPRVDGYRVCRVGEDGIERMLGSLVTKELAGYDTAHDPVYRLLPVAECTLHAASGPMLLGDVQEIIAALAKKSAV